MQAVSVEGAIVGLDDVAAAGGDAHHVDGEGLPRDPRPDESAGAARVLRLGCLEDAGCTARHEGERVGAAPDVGLVRIAAGADHAGPFDDEAAPARAEAPVDGTGRAS